MAGMVLSHYAFGLFVDLGYMVIGLVEIPRIKECWLTADPRDRPLLARGSLLSRFEFYDDNFTKFQLQEVDK